MTLEELKTLALNDKSEHYPPKTILRLIAALDIAQETLQDISEYGSVGELEAATKTLEAMRKELEQL